MRMIYSCCGWAAEIAPDPVWLGSLVGNSFEHPELFTLTCPECGKAVYAHYYNGSPLSGAVHMSGKCDCGWEGYEAVRGWWERATALRDRLAADTPRHRRFRFLHPKTEPATVEELLRWLHR